MKNTLAENMLRFGVKNLKADDIKKIEESVLTEDVVINGVTYKYPFKNAAQLSQYAELMKKTKDVITKLGLNKFDNAAADFEKGMSFAESALYFASITKGLLPSKTNANIALDEIKNSGYIADDQKTLALNAAANVPLFTKWYNSIYLPKWKTAYNTIFPAQTQTTVVNQQQPQVPGKM